MNILKRLVAIVLIATMTCTPVFAETNSLKVVSKASHTHKYDDTGKCTTCGKDLLPGKIFKTKKFKINSNYEAQYLAAICAYEGGSGEGYRYMASLLADRYMIHANKKKYKSVYEYISKSNYFSSQNKAYAAQCAKKRKMSRDQTDVIYLIIQRGLHTIHPFVDEYDFEGDIVYPRSIAKIKRGNKVRNVFGSTYFFYNRPKVKITQVAVMQGNKLIKPAKTEIFPGDVYGYTQKAYDLYKAGKLKP